MKPGDLVEIDCDLCLVIEIDPKVNLVKVFNSETLEIEGWGLDWVERKCEILSRGSDHEAR